MSVATLREALDREYAVAALAGRGGLNIYDRRWGVLVQEHVRVLDFQRLALHMLPDWLARQSHTPPDQIDGRVQVHDVTDMNVRVQVDAGGGSFVFHLFYDRYLPAVRQGAVLDAQ